MSKHIQSTCVGHALGYGTPVKAESNNGPGVRADRDYPGHGVAE